MRLRCPGLSGQRLTSVLIRCPSCGHEVEMFSDESAVRCSHCKTPVRKAAVPTCAKWCRASAECMGMRPSDGEEGTAAP
jgi:endogenous inhibitor of DNA gyrase (YacG/DUF329 family)